MNVFGGIEPPARLINLEYKQHPVNSRKCVECGEVHDTVVEDNRTGERLIEIDTCKDCLMSGCWFNWKPDQKELKSEMGWHYAVYDFDGRNVNMAIELNRLEKEKNGIDK